MTDTTTPQAQPSVAVEWVPMVGKCQACGHEHEVRVDIAHPTSFGKPRRSQLPGELILQSYLRTAPKAVCGLAYIPPEVMPFARDIERTLAAAWGVDLCTDKP